MEVTVKNQQKKIRLKPRQIAKTAKTILKKLKIKDAALTIVFVSRPTIQALNKKYLNRGYATDVLAFDLSDAKFSQSKGKLVGDIFICTDVALQNAKEFGSNVSSEILLYVIHGILHLTGYDDHSPRDIKKMRRKEQELLKVLSHKS